MRFAIEGHVPLEGRGRAGRRGTDAVCAVIIARVAAAKKKPAAKKPAAAKKPVAKKRA